MKSVKYNIDYAEEASRVELIVRFLWSIPTYFVAIILGLISLIAMAVQFLHILAFGKRNKFCHDWLFKAEAYKVKWYAYLFLTDERNPLIPED